MKKIQTKIDGYFIPVRCYKCLEGCIHLEYGNAVFTFTEQQFTVLAEVITETYGKIKAESTVEESDSLECAKPLLM
ncbi:MAG TPA: hypothetical protein VJ302_06215 [Blastocatellia bacterium]|nr:hypothetical protein [Blastocatellia bacterium]